MCFHTLCRFFRKGKGGISPPFKIILPPELVHNNEVALDLPPLNLFSRKITPEALRGHIFREAICMVLLVKANFKSVGYSLSVAIVICLQPASTVNYILH